MTGMRELSIYLSYELIGDGDYAADCATAGKVIVSTRTGN